MYTLNGFGCSFLLHLFAQRPMLISGVGLAAVVGLVSLSPPSPGMHAGAVRTLNAAEARLSEQVTIPVEVTAKFNTLHGQLSPHRLAPEQIQYVLDQCRCTDLTVDAVLNDSELREVAERLYYFDLVHRYGDGPAPLLFQNLLVR